MPSEKITKNWRNPISRDCENFQTCKSHVVNNCPSCPSFQIPTWHKCHEGYFFDSSLDEPSCQPEDKVTSCDDFDVWEPVPSFLQYQYKNGKIFYSFLSFQLSAAVIYHYSMTTECYIL